jgi:hypothetical protein
VPALIKDGICIVISPLIALMKEQVQTLQDKGIKAMALTSGISYAQLDTLLDNCIYGNYKFSGDGSPNWNHTRTSDHPPTPGLWAVEPHVGKDGVGAKFEEILVITESDAYWLDEGGLPHHRAWEMGDRPPFPNPPAK